MQIPPAVELSPLQDAADNAGLSVSLVVPLDKPGEAVVAEKQLVALKEMGFDENCGGDAKSGQAIDAEHSKSDNDART